MLKYASSPGEKNFNMPETPIKVGKFRQAIPTPVHLAEPIAAVRDGLESIKRGEREPDDS